MSKITVAMYPVVAALSLAAAFSAQAQSKNDPIDQAAYGATVVETSSAPAPVVAKAAQPAVRFSFAALFASRQAPLVDAVDQAGYGPTIANTASVRTRAEVRAEAIAARDAGYEATYREGADPQYAVMQRAKTVDTAHVVAGKAAKSGE